MLSLLLAQTRFEPLFGNQWLALLAVLGGVAVFMALIAIVGRWLAATHPESPKVASAPAATPAALPSTGPAPEIIAVIAASVAARLGAQARITVIRPAPVGPNVETLMAQWSLEGRRQIYSSHQIR
jgi:hypothetical protein